MGGSTAAIGILPGYASIGCAAPVILVILRMLQGLALGGEYGGAAVYVAEHVPIRGGDSIRASFRRLPALVSSYLWW